MTAYPRKEFFLATHPKNCVRQEKKRIIDTKVMALGGITPDNILEIKDFGFGGAVVLGDLWNKFNVCTDRDYLGVIRHFKKLKEMAD